MKYFKEIIESITPSGSLKYDDEDQFIRLKPVSETVDDSEKKQLSIDEIYPDVVPGDMGTVLELLSKSAFFLEDAVKSYDEHLVTSDEYVQQFQSLLSELVYFRTISEGFGIIITSLLIALSNKKGIPLEKNQLVLIKHLIFKLKNEPFLTTSESIDLCDELEENGFEFEEIINELNSTLDEFIS